MEIKERISSATLTHFILGLGGDFSARYNSYFDRIVIDYRGKLLTSYERAYLPRHDMRSDIDGDVLGRGYQHILQTIWEGITSGSVYVHYEKRRELIKILEKLHYYKDPHSYGYHKTAKDRDIEKKVADLKRQGVEVHTDIEK